ncbi:MAG: peptidylprolyl isomerase [Gammaproteobacteria bacterium]|nr:peptidylprolyl isomerase [Gammaproteobacteria bacterium]
MIQGGGHNPDMTMRPERQTIRNEADNGLKNVTGTIAMARMSGIDSAARQFFINVADNTHLDHKPTSCTREEVAEVKAARKQGRAKPLTCDGYGYTVFGRVIRGMDVIREMEIRETATRGGHRNVPVEPIVIESMSVIDDEAATAP